MRQLARFAATTVAILVTASPALGAEDFRELAGSEQHRSAFAGATLRLDLGGRSAKTPQARLGLGFLQDRRNSAGAYMGRAVSEMPIALGVVDDRLKLFAGREPLSRSRARLALSGESTALLVVGGIAAGVVAIMLLSDDDDDERNNPCPPGVEVCAF